MLLKFQQDKVTDFLTHIEVLIMIMNNDCESLGRHFLRCMIVNYLVVLQKGLYCIPLVWTTSQTA